MRNQTTITHYLVLLLSVLFVSSSSKAESWTDLSGTRTVEAEMIGLWNDTVVLQMLDGRRISMPLSKLKASSRIQAQDLARAKQQALESMVQELQGQAKEASAPAPNPLPQPPAAAAYVPPSKGAACQEQVQWLQDQSRAGHVLLAQFDAMPPALQADAEEMIKSGLAKVGAPTIGAIHQIGDLIVTRQRWLFNHPRLAALDQTSFEKVKELLLGVGGAVRAGLDPKVMDLNQMAVMPTRSWIAKIDAAIAPHVAKMNEMAPQPQITVGEEKNGIAAVTQDMGDGVTMTMNFELVDGFWIPEGAKDQIAMAKEQLANADAPGAMGAAMIGAMIGTQIQPLVAAKTEQEFHASMEAMFVQAAPMVQQVAALTGSFGDSSGRGRPGSNGFARSGSNGPGEESFDMDEMDMEEEMMSGSGGMSDAAEEAAMEAAMEAEMAAGMGN